MSKPKTGPQDLPPKGGYAPFQIERIKLRNVIKGPVAGALFIAVNIIGFPLYYKNWVMLRKDMIEKRSKELALLPLLCAERERIELKRLKHLRKLEAEVMNDFPFWEVGTLFGVQIYESLPENEYIPITLLNYYLLSDLYSPPALAMEPLFK